MSFNKRIVLALKKASSFLKESMAEEDEDLIANRVWYVAAELEYALFFFLMTIEDELDKSKWKSDPKLRKAKVDTILAAVEKLVNKAERCIEGDKLLDSYKWTHVARNCLLDLQKHFAKKKRERLKKKK
ncbi:hypothetical protein GTO27_08895 [Candidatus Bathyarchaeota archaeon]|nr:hypothetical protein [Candidatus Bathyarchaeota archaeon]